MKIIQVVLKIELDKEGEEQFFIDGKLNECEVSEQVHHKMSCGDYEVDIMEPVEEPDEDTTPWW